MLFGSAGKSNRNVDNRVLFSIY